MHATWPPATSAASASRTTTTSRSATSWSSTRWRSPASRALPGGPPVSHRIQRVNALIQRELSQLLQRHLRDPRITLFLHVTAVDTSPDLTFAKVYVSSAEGEPGDRAATM